MYIDQCDEMDCKAMAEAVVYTSTGWYHSDAGREMTEDG